MKPEQNRNCSKLCCRGITKALKMLFRDDFDHALNKKQNEATDFYTDHFSLEDLFQILESKFGQQTTNGLLFRIGGIAFQTWRREDAQLRALGEIENRLLPFNKKIFSALEQMALFLEREMNITINIHALGLTHWDIYIPHSNEVDSTVAEKHAWLVQGILFEFLTWMDSRKIFRFSTPSHVQEHQRIEFAFSASAME